MAARLRAGHLRVRVEIGLAVEVAGEVRGVVEATQDPAAVERHDLRDGRVRGTEEGERPAGPGDLAEDLPDDPAVAEHRRALAGVGGDDALEDGADPRADGVGRLGTGDR